MCEDILPKRHGNFFLCMINCCVIKTLLSVRSADEPFFLCHSASSISVPNKPATRNPFPSFLSFFFFLSIPSVFHVRSTYYNMCKRSEAFSLVYTLRKTKNAIELYDFSSTKKDLPKVLHSILFVFVLQSRPEHEKRFAQSLTFDFVRVCFIVALSTKKDLTNVL